MGLLLTLWIGYRYAYLLLADTTSAPPKAARILREAAGQHEIRVPAFLNPEADEASIRKEAKEHAAVLKDRAAVNAVLTPEQLKPLKSLKSAP